MSLMPGNSLCNHFPAKPSPPSPNCVKDWSPGLPDFVGLDFLSSGEGFLRIILEATDVISSCSGIEAIDLAGEFVLELEPALGGLRFPFLLLLDMVLSSDESGGIRSHLDLSIHKAVERDNKSSSSFVADDKTKQQGMTCVTVNPTNSIGFGSELPRRTPVVTFATKIRRSIDCTIRLLL